MVKTVLTAVSRVVLATLGVFFLATAVVDLCFSRFGLGAAMTIGAAALCFVCALAPRDSLKRIPLILRLLVCTLTAVILGLYVFVFCYGRHENLTYDEHAVIVLGCGLRGDQPSTSLMRRLDRAIAYHKEHPDALLVVSGGKGTDEVISEAAAMERYLLDHGVEADAIVKEDASTSTAENFQFSKALLDKRFASPYRVAFISNDYHIYRAEQMAKEVGFTDATHGYAPTLWPTVITGGLRECAAVCAYWIRF